MKPQLPHLAVVGLLVLASTACGGSKPPKTAAEATTAGPGAGTEDMPPPPPATPSHAAPSTTPDTPSAPTTAAVRVVALKLAAPAKDAKKVGFTTLEVKDDGAILVDGKPAGKVTSEGLKDEGGKATLSVAPNGAVTSDGGKPGKFSANDDLVLDDGGKIHVSDDGAVMVTDDKGKADVLPAKFDGVSAWAKREAALLVAGLFVMKKPAAAPAAANLPPAKKK